MRCGCDASGKNTRADNMALRNGKIKRPLGTVVLFAVWATISGLVIAYFLPTKTKIPPDLIGVVRPIATTIAPFRLVDQHERGFALQRLAGRWTFLFFGYTYCPDICPATMSVLRQLRRELPSPPDAAPAEQMVFVSVDPERDSPAVMSAYLSYFGDDFVGAGGPEKDLKPFAGQFGAMYSREPGTTSDAYLMSHTSSIFLVSPKSELVAVFSPPHDAKTIAAQFAEIRKLF